MRFSKAFFPTLKEAPAEAVVPSSTPEPSEAPADKATESTTEPAKAAAEVQDEPEGQATNASPTDGQSSLDDVPKDFDALAALKPEEKIVLMKADMQSLNMSQKQIKEATERRGKKGDKLKDLAPDKLEEFRASLDAFALKRGVKDRPPIKKS